MADLGNSKIKDTYTLVLQTDVSGNLQKLDGTTPSPFIVNGNLRYVDGNQALNYVLTSDASGNASWSEAGGTSYWSANTDGSISPSGLTTNLGVGTITPNKSLTVVGAISGTTDLYLGSATHTASTITAEEELRIKGTAGNDYLFLTEDFIQIFYDGSEDIGLNYAGIALNASSRDRNVQINSEDGTALFTTNASKNVVRLLDYVSINKPDTWTWQNEQKQALAVSGTSVFYSGGSTHTPEAIVAVGNISGTTDLHIDGNMYSGTTNLLDIFASSAITNQDVYWSANTDGSISPSGSTTIQTEGDLRVSGTVYTNNITTTATSTDTLTIQSDMIDFQSHGGSIEYLRIKDDAIQYYLDNLQGVTFHSPTHASPGFIFNTSSQDLPFKIFSDDTTTLFRTYADTNAVHMRDHVMISSKDGFPSLVTGSDWALAVTGSSLFYSGGTSTPSNAITAVGDISGTTDLYLGDSVHTASTITAEESLTIKGRGVDNDYLHLDQDMIWIQLDGAQYATFVSNTHPSAGGGAQFNASGQEYDFDILGGDGTPIFQLTGAAGANRIRIRDHVTIGPNSSISHVDAVNWGLAVTGSSLFYSGGTTDTNTNAISAVGDISGTTNLHIDGDTYTTDLVLDGGKVRPAASGGEVIFANADHGSADWLTLSQDLFVFKLNGIEYARLDPDEFLINSSNRDQDFSIKTLTGNFSVQNNAEYDLLALSSAGGTTIGGTTSRWPTDTGQPTTANKTLLVHGITTIYSGGPETYSWSGDTTALSVAGNISGETDLHIGGIITTEGDINVGNDVKFVDNGQAIFGDGDDLKIYHSGSHSIIQESGIGNLLLKGGAVKIMGTTTGDDCAVFTENAGVELYYDDVKKFETTNDGITLFDDANISGNTLYDGTISGTGSVTAVGGFVGDVTGDLTGNADTVTNGVYTTNNLSVMASTTSAQLAGVISDETGSGSLTFGTSPTIVTPIIQYPKTYFAEPNSTPVASIAGADIVKEFGDNVATTAGDIYVFNTLGSWTVADASAVGTAQGLLAVALGSESDEGMLLRGMVTVGTLTPSVGSPIYLSEDAGDGTATVPTTSGAVVRLIGYSINSARNQIWFNPDNTWVELT